MAVGERMSKLRPLVWAAVALAILLLPAPARAIVVEKVVAVVGEKAILLTDLRKRARPFLVQLHQKVPKGPQRAAAESKMYGQLLERMVDEELEQLAAARSHTKVDSDDVDKTIRRIAKMGGTTVERLIAEVATSSGMTEQEYRREIRRQVLEGKLLQRITQNRIRITEQDLRTMYDRVIQQERQVRQYDVAWIVLRVGKTPSAEYLAERKELAQQLVARARAGEDFGMLAEQYTDDPATRAAGGRLGVRAPSMSPAALTGRRESLEAPVEQVALKLEVDEISDPVRFRDTIVVLKILARQPSRFTSFEASQAEMVQRVKAKKFEKAKVKWLKDERRRTHVDVRW